MPIFWLSLIFALVLTVAAAIYATLKGLEAFRAFKRLGGAIGSELSRIEAATGQIERHLELAAESGTTLEASLARLRASRARLNVLTSALADVRAAVGRVTAVVPRK
jgi:tRNA threonylcarbamoyladenosine modification (KEOPS) complex Cgi121 subunit